MKIIRSPLFRHSLAFIAGALIGLGYFASVTAANADTVYSQISVANNGNVQVKSARIVKVNGNEITALTEWGSVQIMWNVHVSGSTRFTPQADSRSGTKALSVGQVIAFSGTMDRQAKTPTVYASTLRNETLVQASAVVGGSVISVSDNEILILTPTGTTTVTASNGTITTIDGNTATLLDVATGTEIKAFGMLDTEHGIMKAQKISVTLPKIPNTGTLAPKQSLIEKIAGWFGMKGSAITVR